MNQRWMWTAFSAFGFGAVSLVAQSDNTFLNANWNATKLGISSASSTFTSSQDTANGNSLPSRTTVLTYPGTPGGMIFVAHVYQPFVYDPVSQGAIGTLSYSYDLRHYNPPNGQAVAYKLLILQNNTYYVGPLDSIFTNAWQTFSHPNLPCAGFIKIPGAGAGANNPDCSCTGSKIQLGYITAVSTLGGQANPAQRTSGIDNWSVTLNKVPDPVPSFTVSAVQCVDPATQGRGNGIPVIEADGSASVNATNYFWSVEESDANWGRNPQSERSKWFTGQAGPIDLGGFYASLGGQWKCNTYYRVKLAVDWRWWSQCAERLGSDGIAAALGQFDETSRIHRVERPGAMLTKILKDVAQARNIAITK